MESAPKDIVSNDNELKVEKQIEGSSEKNIKKVDDIFSDLLNSVKNAPEAKQEALKVLIAQMKQIGEQMRQVRDANNLQELKALMLKHWAELTELTKDNPELFGAIQEWGKKFVDGKKLYYDYINEVKDDLIDKSQEIGAAWLSIQSEIGKIQGLLGNSLMGEASSALNQLNNSYFDNGKGKSGFIGKLISSLTGTANGFETEDIDIESANIILSQLAVVVRGATKASYEEKSERSGGSSRPIESNPELRGILENLERKINVFSSNIKDASKIMKVIKKIRDTHFLDLYNEQAQ